MSFTTRLAAITSVASALLVLGCGAKAPTAPPPASSSQAASATGLTVGFGSSAPERIKQADTIRLKATATFADGSTGDCTEAAIWTSSDSQIAAASTSRQGDFQAVAGGAVKAIATCGPISAELPLSVLGVTAVTPSVPGANPSGLIIGQQFSATVTVTFSDGSSETCAAPVWTSTNPSVAAVNSDRALSPTGAGSTTITASCRNASGSLEVTVRPGLRISGMESQPFVLQYKNVVTVRADVVNAAGQVVRSCDSAVWTSSNLNVIAPISNSGGSGMILSPRSEGAATLTATCGENVGVLETRVQPYTIAGVVRSTSGAPVPNARLIVRYLDMDWDHSSWDEEFRSDSDGSFSVRARMSPATIHVKGDDFLAADSVMTWNRQPTMSTSFSLQPATNAMFSGTESVCSGHPSVSDAQCAGSPRGRTYEFMLDQPATFQVELYPLASAAWTTTRLPSVDLVCRGFTQIGVSTTLPDVRRWNVPASQACQLRFSNGNTTPARLDYRFVFIGS